MKIHIALLVPLALAFAGCGTTPYAPQEYPLRDGLIKPITMTGTLSINNAQSSTSEAIVYSYMGTELGSNYKDITQLMVDQAKKEALKNFKQASADRPKTIDIKVTYLKSTYIAFYWKSELKYTATLGGSIVVDKTVHHGSGILIQDLNGCIAESVMDLLNDPKVTAYLNE
jgi:hypothetical protein